ncbi:chromosome partitioning protein ParA [Pseudomonas sp. A46]|nr:AAA family ATPase [Pseudomonas sp. A46]OWJ92880.1 chromosome partitioning protein ParA [Pseudomonas sp. A46]
MADAQAQESYPYTDFDSLYLPPQFAADALGISLQTLKAAEPDLGVDIRRVPRGTVSARVYTLGDIFKIAALRREKGLTKSLPRPITMSVYVQKGGTGKTTCTVNLGLSFAFAGYRTLIIDNDPQADASSMLGYDPDLTPAELEEIGVPADRAVNGHLGNLLGLGNMFPPLSLDKVVKKPFGEYGPHLIPAWESLEDLEVALNSANNPDFRYASHIVKARAGQLPGCDFSAYDVIIFDNAPSGSRLTRNSMVASDFLVCPIRMDKFSFRALTRLSVKLAAFQEDFQRSPEIIAIPTMFIKNRPRAMADLALLSELFPGKVTDSKLFFNEDYSKALGDGVPIIAWKGGSDNSLGAMRQVFAESLQRIRETLQGPMHRA